MKKKISCILSIIMIISLMIVYNVPVMAAPNEPEEFEDNLIEEISSSVSKLDGNEDTTWQEDFEYTMSGENIVLRKYKGSATELTIPSKAKINGVEYSVKLNDDCSCFFYNNTTIKSIEFEDGIDASGVTDMNSMFSACKKLTSIDLSNLVTTNVTDMTAMFSECSNLRSLDLSSFYTQKVKYMDYMFSKCSSIEILDLSSFDMRNASETTGMFNECYNLVKIKTPINAKYGTIIPDGFCDSEDISVKYSYLPHNQQNSITIIKYFAVRNVYIYPKNSSVENSNRISSKRINIGDSFELKADVQPRNATNPDVVWSSDNSNVATVDSEGNVVGVGLGTALIKATSVDNNEIYASCYFTVTTPVSGIQLLPETKTISIGNGFKIIPSITPNDAVDKSVSWNSDNPDIATVDDEGKVTAVSVGVTSITATTTDGGFVSQCIVTVTKPVEGIIVSPESCKVNIGDTHSLSAEVTPDGADTRVVWSSSDDSIARVDENGIVTGIKAGTVTITATTVDGNMTDQCSVRVSDPNDTTWQDNFYYSLYDGKIILNEYKGTVEELVIPSTARIDGIIYNVVLMNDSSRFFSNNNKLKSISFDGVNTSNVTDMSRMFQNCSNLQSVDLSGLDTSNVTNMSGMFLGCRNLHSIDLSSLDMRCVNETTDMFGNNWNSGINEITIPLNLESEISLPYTFFDIDDHTKEYNLLPTKQTTSFTIVKKNSVSGITISPTQKNIIVGDDFTITPVITPSDATDKSVTFVSDNPTIASVDNEGKVTGVSEGSTNIKVKTVDGEKVATCYVTVSPIKHSYKNPVFQWSSDSKSCKATYTCDGISCKTGSKHTVIYDCDVTSEVLSLPTCSRKGITRYTATYGTDSDTKTIKDIPTTDNHDFDYDNPEFNWSKGRKSCTVTYYCKNDMSHTVTYDCDVTSEVVTPATCENKGTTKYTATYNGITNTKVVKDIPKTAHTCENVITKATASKDGKIEQVCTECDEVIKTTKINKIESMSLSLSKATYTGKAIQPTVTVLDSSGKIIDPDYYTVKYINNTNVGTATVKVVFKNLYKGSLSKTFTIIPKKTLITAASSPKKGSMKVTWNKQATETTGYEIQVSPVTNFKKNVKTVNVAKPAAKAKTITGLKKGKNYVRIRTYKIVNGTRYYSAWSKYGKAVTVK